MRNITVITNNVSTSAVEDYDEWETLAQTVLKAYYVLLNNWQKKFMPSSNSSALDSRFIESVKNCTYVWMLCYRFENGSRAERLAMKADISLIEERLYRYHRSCITYTGCSADNF